MLGVEQKMTPADAIAGDAYSQDLTQLPVNWASAIEAFGNGEHVQQIFSKQLQTLLVDCKTQEVKRFAREVSDFEYHSYLEVV